MEKKADVVRTHKTLTVVQKLRFPLFADTMLMLLQIGHLLLFRPSETRDQTRLAQPSFERWAL